MTDSKTIKDVAVEFLQFAATGKVREAYTKHTAKDFRHHNPFYKGDAESLIVAMEENATKMPNKVIEIIHAVAEGNVVMVHSRVELKPSPIVVGLVHIFRFEGDKIAEFWDLGQAVPATSPNENGMF